jgi:hypothetical protein
MLCIAIHHQAVQPTGNWVVCCFALLASCLMVCQLGGQQCQAWHSFLNVHHALKVLL